VVGETLTKKEDVITKTYDLLLYIIPQLAKFPRDQKFLLADRIETLILEFLEDMIEAYYSAKELALLERGNLKLEKLRYLIRLCHDVQFINHRRYGLISEKIDEIGRMAGGWRKSVQSHEKRKKPDPEICSFENLLLASKKAQKGKRFKTDTAASI